MSDLADRQHIIDYYDATDFDYRLFWDLRRSLAIHFGYWDETTHTLPDALRRMNQMVAASAHVTKQDRVLDAGCGIGGSALFLASSYGCHVDGITLSQPQVNRAIDLAKRKKLSTLASFWVMDYTHTSFSDASFDVVWAIESVCHADNKRQFIREAYRLLKPGGRLVVSDGWAKKSSYAATEEKIMRHWLDGWAVPGLATVEQFRRNLEDTGFKQIGFVDWTPQIWPTSRRLFIMSLPGLFLGYPAEWLGLRRRVQTNNFLAAHYQYRALKKNLWQYGIFTAVKA